MAQLKDSIVVGSLRVTDTIYTTDFNMTASKTAAYVLASPASAAGAPTFRTLTATDIPTLTKSKISDFAHTHGSISNDGKIGTATAAVYVNAGTITASSFAMVSPTASGSATAFISSVTQNANGSITATKANLPVASSSVTGIIKIGTDATDAAAGNHNHDSTYVNVTGDTMTGDLTITCTANAWPATQKMLTLKTANNRDFGFKVTNYGANVDIGYDWSAVDGPGCAFRSSGHSSEPGYFYIYARSTAGTTQLKGTPAGVLTWGNQNVMASAGASNSTSALYLIGATTQTTGPLTYSNSHLFAEDGALSAKTLGINNSTTTSKVTLQWNTTSEALEFVF